MIERIAIIDHDNHNLIIDDVDMDILEEKYHGKEEMYISSTYDLDNYSWDYIINISHFPAEEEPIDLEIESWINLQ